MEFMKMRRNSSRLPTLGRVCPAAPPVESRRSSCTLGSFSRSFSERLGWNSPRAVPAGSPARSPLLPRAPGTICPAKPEREGILRRRSCMELEDPKPHSGAMRSSTLNDRSIMRRTRAGGGG